MKHSYVGMVVESRLDHIESVPT